MGKGNVRTPVSQPIDVDSKSSLLDLHIAEYEALMTRNTYLMTLQFSLWPVFLLILAFVAQLWSMNKISGRILLWVVEMGSFMVGIVWSDALWEMYNNVTYIEHRLKPFVRRVAGAQGVWRYEEYLGDQRGSKFMLWEWMLPMAGAVMFVVTIIVAWPLSVWEYGTAACVAIQAGKLWQRCASASQLRRHFLDHTT